MINRHRQRGAALFIVLILLLVVTIIGVSSMNDTLMQGKMASAMQDGNIALQGVESAIRDAEKYLGTIVATTDFNNTNGLYTEGNGPNAYAATTWTSTNSRKATAVSGLKEQSRYYIELVGQVEAEDSSTNIQMGNDSHDQSSGTVTAFRIVARSSGASGISQRVVESFYGVTF